jgi:hypothetical protein
VEGENWERVEFKMNDTLQFLICAGNGDLFGENINAIKQVRKCSQDAMSLALLPICCPYQP